MGKLNFLLIFFLLIIPIFANALYIEVSTLKINASLSNATYTPNLNSTYANISINKTGILLGSLNYVNKELGVNISHVLFINGNNVRINTTSYPFLNYSDNNTKNVSFLLTGVIINATLTFNVANCGNLSNMTYLSRTGSFNYNIKKINISCYQSRASTYIIGIERAIPPNANKLSIFYFRLTSWEMAVIFTLAFSAFMLYTSLNSFSGRREDNAKECNT